MELTAAGLYRIYTCFPFNPLPEYRKWNQSVAKVVLFFEIENRVVSFL
jgi:hypothetical protein